MRIDTKFNIGHQVRYEGNQYRVTSLLVDIEEDIETGETTNAINYGIDGPRGVWFVLEDQLDFWYRQRGQDDSVEQEYTDTYQGRASRHYISEGFTHD